jgi:uncharacterized membrane protein (TIGR02234 family)
MSESGLRRLSPRRELLLAVLLGLAGAGLVLLAVRQGWAHVRTAAPRPLPGSNVALTGQDLVPAAGALAIAALASLAAVLATRGLVRRVVGLLLAAFGIGIAAAVSAGITAADAIAAAAGNAGSAGSAGSAGTAGSVTAGSAAAGGAQGGAPPIAGFPAHVVMTSLPWRALTLVGAVVVVAAGLLVAWRAANWPAMSSRFDPPERARPRQAALAARRAPAVGDTATIWESLSRGEDPTDGRPGERQAEGGSALGERHLGERQPGEQPAGGAAAAGAAAWEREPNDRQPGERDWMKPAGHEVRRE